MREARLGDAVGYLRLGRFGRLPLRGRFGAVAKRAAELRHELPLRAAVARARVGAARAALRSRFGR